MYEVHIAKRCRFRQLEYYPGETRVINGPTFERFKKFKIIDKWTELNPADLSKYEGRESGPCVVVGGGPSLRGFPWDVLRDWDCVACNMAIRYVPWAKYMVSMDFTPILEDPAKLEDVRAFNGQVFVKCDGGRIHPEAREFNVVECVPTEYITESFTEGVHAIHSGQAAVQVAMHLGYNPIYLLGVDCKMGPKDMPFHHYDDGLSYDYDDNQMRKWSRLMNAQARSYHARGVEVINISLNSDLVAYNTKDWRKILDGN